MAVDVILDPPERLPRIETLWAFVSVDDQGGEGLCATTELTGFLMPLIAADQRRLDQLVPIAERLARYTGKRVVLVEFTGRVDVRQIGARTK